MQLLGGKSLSYPQFSWSLWVLVVSAAYHKACFITSTISIVQQYPLQNQWTTSISTLLLHYTSWMKNVTGNCMNHPFHFHIPTANYYFLMVEIISIWLISEASHAWMIARFYVHAKSSIVSVTTVFTNTNVRITVTNYVLLFWNDYVVSCKHTQHTDTHWHIFTIYIYKYIYIYTMYDMNVYERTVVIATYI